MNRYIFTGHILCVVLLFFASPAMAARYALLVGVADYPNVTRLYGPANDVASLKELLAARYNLPVANITTLVNNWATKKNILKALSDLKDRTRAGDFIFFYFSGHGTSSFDREAALDMDNSTGAIIPYDFSPAPGNPRKTLERLIIGRRDLQPVLLELDKDRTLFVVFDSCYSGNAVRAIRSGRGIPKFVPLDIPADSAEFSAIKDVPFPYQTLVYLSAAHQTETADDLRPEDTHDGKAHGALTDALLLGLKGSADLNHNGKITYEELHEYAKQKMQTVSRHTPQAKSNRSLAAPALEHDKEVVSTAPQAAVSVPALTRVQVTGTNVASLTKTLSGLKKLQIVAERPDLRLTSAGSRITFYLPGGDQLCIVNSVKEARTRVERFTVSRELLALMNPAQNFNLFLRPLGDQGKTVFFKDEKLGLQITSEADAHLLLLNIDSTGYVTPLLPNTVNDNRISANSPLNLAEIGVIEPPLGVEYLKLFAFRKPVTGFSRFIGKTLSPVGSEFSQLLSLIQSQQGWSSTTMEVVTIEKK